MSADGAVAQSKLQSATGNIRVLAATDAALADVYTGANVSVTATSGNISNATNAGTAAENIEAATLRLMAGTGIGSGADALQSQVNTASARTGSGGLFLNATRPSRWTPSRRSASTGCSPPA